MLVALLSPTLGSERSDEIVTETARSLGAPGEELTPDEAETVLAHLAEKPGLVGLAARHAQKRRVSFGEVESVGEAPPVSSGTTSTGARIHLSDLEAVLAPSLGEDRAREVVATYAAKVGVVPPDCTKQEALALLDAMASAEGLVGVVARFAKARLHLRLAG